MQDCQHHGVTDDKEEQVSSTQQSTHFEGAIDLTKPIGSSNLRIRLLEAEHGKLGSDRWSGKLDPFPWYQEMLVTNDGVHRDETIGVWMAFSHPEVQRVLSDATTFSSEYGNLGLQNVDDPLHRKLRLLVTHAFTPKRVGALEQRIAEVANRLIDGFAAAGAVDLVKEFTQPLSTTVIAELLGIPADDHSAFRRWTYEVSLGAVSFSEGQAVPEAPRQMAAYFAAMIEERRHSPDDGLITALIDAEVEGEKLSDGDIFNFCVLLLVAGNETTGNLIGNAVRLLSEHPEVRREIRADRSLLGPALEEVLRFRGSIQSMMRIAKDGAQIGGHEVESGSYVLAWIGAANRDPSVFDLPDVFDIHRSPNRHIAFGHGGHFCLGANLARLESRTALTVLDERLGDVDVAPGAVLTPLNTRIFYGVSSLPVVFAPGGADR
jgi:cytochrome P450